jgi:hypothetical protein
MGYVLAQNEGPHLLTNAMSQIGMFLVNTRMRSTNVYKAKTSRMVLMGAMCTPLRIRKQQWCPNIFILRTGSTCNFTKAGITRHRVYESQTSWSKEQNCDRGGPLCHAGPCHCYASICDNSQPPVAIRKIRKKNLILAWSWLGVLIFQISSLSKNKHKMLGLQCSTCPWDVTFNFAICDHEKALPVNLSWQKIWECY